MKRKFIFLMMMYLLGGVMPSNMMAQDDSNVVTIGEGSVDYDGLVPIQPYYRTSISQQYYLKSEINHESGTIKEIAFHTAGNSDNYPCERSIKVYMRNTGTEEYLFSDRSMKIVTEEELVYQGNITFEENSWVTITLQNTFNYLGNNILLCVYDYTGDFAKGNDMCCFYVRSTGFDNRANYKMDKNVGDPTASSIQGSLTTIIPEIKLTFATESDNEDDENITPATPTFVNDGEWTEPTNWQANFTPEDGDDVIIKAAAIIPTGSTVTPGNITFNGGSLTLADGAQLISNQENLEVTIQKEIKGYTSDKNGWYSISAPISNSENNLGNLQTGSYDFYRYDEENHEWENVKDNSNTEFNSLESGRGYLYANSNNITLEFTGTLNNSDVQYNLSKKSEVLEGFNLIGNPFSHNIYVNQTMINSSSLVLEITMMDSYDNVGDGWNDNYLSVLAGNTFYELYMNSGGSLTHIIEVEPNTEIYINYVKKGRYPEENSIKVKYQGENDYFFEWDYKSNPTSTNDQTIHYFVAKSNNTQLISEGYYTLSNEGAWDVMLDASEAIKPCQGILVKALEEGTLTIKKDATVPAQKRSSNPSIAINVANEKYNDVAYATFGNGVGLDKIAHRNENIPMISIPVDDIDYAIAVLDEDINEIPVHFEAKTMGYYTINVKAQNFKSNELTLVDRMTGENINMLEGGYTFMATTTDDANRFFIRLANSQEPTANSNFAYVSGEDLIFNVEGSVQIIDMMGRVVYTSEIESANNRINVSDFNSAAYIIRVVNENGVKVQKLIVNSL